MYQFILFICKGFISKLLFTYSQKILIRYLNRKRNLRPEKGICCYFMKLYYTIDTVIGVYWISRIILWISLCSNVLPPWQHFEMSHTGIQPSDNIVWPQCMMGRWQYPPIKMFIFHKADIYWAFSKALKCSNKTVNIGAMTFERKKSFCLQCWSAFWKWKSNAWLDGPHFGSNSLLYRKRPQSNIGGGGGFGIDWFIKTERTAHLWPVIVTGRKSMNTKNNAFFILFVTSKIWKQIYTQHQKPGD